MDLSAFVGLPWADKGRSEDGCDCWGLCCLVYRTALAIELPSYSEFYATPADRKAVSGLIAGHQPEWSEVHGGLERVLDLVLMTEAGIPRHIGIVARPGLVLHMAPGRESVIEPYTTGKVKHRLAGFFRHKSL